MKLRFHKIFCTFIDKERERMKYIGNPYTFECVHEYQCEICGLRFWMFDRVLYTINQFYEMDIHKKV